ncbi:PREDICTED: shikimate O-hydroxycinnamoyltransferase-like isoform X2 [Ipomoea nil]|uniref:shikimate O-hydroxycinnamoyltransferase-like isoform X2 n=1 Tax=Ipomoea nil TaxID=35883 RepID=UPI000900F9AA|nr:PREDICTED: shikimate O-hydroxycinnamoyltransferase-like isoform X2 [Ipomoea nil]
MRTQPKDCADNNCDFVVTMKSEEVVKARLGAYEHWLPMSNLDLLIPPLDFGVFFCYYNNNAMAAMNDSCCISLRSPEKMVGVIKKALAETLVSFYPFCGEVVHNGHGEPELHCNNHGVNFNHAYADVEMKNLDLFRPDVSVHGKLVPDNTTTGKAGVLSVQVTELKCGGLVVGCTFDHRVADAHSANMFLVAWADTARANNTSFRPSFRRSLLNPRRPPSHYPSLDEMYLMRSSLPPPPIHDDDEDRLISRIYYVPSDQIALLQSLASGGGQRRSKLESFSAFLWKTVAQGCKGGGDDGKRCRLGVVVDGRQRMMKSCFSPSALQSYVGNVLSVPFSEASVTELRSTPLSGVAERVHACLENAARESHFLALIDWVEVHRPEQAIVRVYCKEEGQEAAVVVSSGLKFPVSQVDFGWGAPGFGSYHFPWGGQTGYVMPMPSVHCNGDWIVYVHLLKRYLDVLETQAAHVFKPLNHIYLNTSFPASR